MIVINDRIWQTLEQNIIVIKNNQQKKIIRVLSNNKIIYPEGESRLHFTRTWDGVWHPRDTFNLSLYEVSFDLGNGQTVVVTNNCEYTIVGSDTLFGTTIANGDTIENPLGSITVNIAYLSNISGELICTMSGRNYYKYNNGDSACCAVFGMYNYSNTPWGGPMLFGAEPEDVYFTWPNGMFVAVPVEIISKKYKLRAKYTYQENDYYAFTDIVFAICIFGSYHGAWFIDSTGHLISYYKGALIDATGAPTYDDTVIGSIDVTKYVFKQLNQYANVILTLKNGQVIDPNDYL